VFVLGEPEYYESFGFATESAKKFQSPYSDPYFMALELGKNAFQAMSKQASYASPFPEFD
jgi:putative acetyltransferase